MVFVTGDCHSDFGKFSSKNFPKQKKMTKDDYVIILEESGIQKFQNIITKRNTGWIG